MESELNSFDRAARMAALVELARRAATGEVEVARERCVANMHCHTFFSFNAYDHSPASLAWMARRDGFAAAGIVDFDVLDGVDEFLEAADIVGVRASAGIETRVFIPEFSSLEINSPGEPGVCYHMGIGFTSAKAPPQVSPILAALRARAERRNRDVLARVMAHLAPLEVDYDTHVLPLTPSGNATERHMLAAIVRSAELRFPRSADRIKFWAARLHTPEDEVDAARSDYAKFSSLVRARLMKRGGVGYAIPTPASFPSVDEFHRLILACGALPCAAWLDGTSPGEQAIEVLLELLMGRGVAALNIIPDRNWNISEPETRRVKLARLHDIAAIAAELDLPLNVGTEMNSPGNKLVDDFDIPELAPLRSQFLAGAYFVYGHTVLQRGLGLGYQSQWAQAHLPGRRERNAFYERIGREVPPGRESLARLASLGSTASPEAIVSAFARRDAAR